VTELDYIRVSCDERPAPSAEAIARSRAALRRELATVRGRRSVRPRLHVYLLASTAIAAVVLVGALALTSSQASFGVRIAAAASEAMNPATDDLMHSVSRTTSRSINRNRTIVTRRTDDSWSTTAPPTMVDRTTDAAGRTTTTFVSNCGFISYDPGSNLFTVSPELGTFGLVDSPVRAAANALRTGRIHYRGNVVYHGIQAAKLVVTQYGATTTYIVRRDTGYPLETINRRVTSHFTETLVTTYSFFEHVARTPQSARHLQLTVHPSAFVVRTGRASTTPDCRAFGSLARLTGRRSVP
jgi:hypothetical protein